MGKRFPALLPEHEAFIRKQNVFFVASAPLAGDGHVNVSPKGYDVFRLLSSDRAAYLDLTGSGSETSAHLLENGRLTIMFCAFEGPPNILRLYGKGEVILPGSEQWERLAPLFPTMPGARQIVAMRIEEVQTSCGFGVPLMSYEGDRETLTRWAESKGETALEEYRAAKNAVSLDGLPTPFRGADK
ncbi:pyridoxamine 5'-phosphate oxidase family protein [Paenibacillus sp.]|uniref:pyridoxamine 5'-phosphate oxidase family protein n=1 Tax=Paenibacillus sp. TaxID=58172 RepID=UPI002D754896|nr:pyridoxamine 5'-phosphate oxidase family protein [Paenibacillus sp.]HZG83574.1 pyridoxamine 5'-phosphate oxidase family protein [Paenibacillus sp.]